LQLGAGDVEYQGPPNGADRAEERRRDIDQGEAEFGVGKPAFGRDDIIIIGGADLVVSAVVKNVWIPAAAGPALEADGEKRFAPEVEILPQVGLDGGAPQKTIGDGKSLG
jgi:hypothetical protein